MYAGPIEQIYKDMEVKVEQQLEETIIKAVKKCDIEVDKEEFIKALQYDRDQYRKGYNDALNEIRAEIMELDVDYDFEGFYKCQSKVLGIIDKYKKQKVRVRYDIHR